MNTAARKPIIGREVKMERRPVWSLIYGENVRSTLVLRQSFPMEALRDKTCRGDTQQLDTLQYLLVFLSVRSSR